VRIHSWHRHNHGRCAAGGCPWHWNRHGCFVCGDRGDAARRGRSRAVDADWSLTGPRFKIAACHQADRASPCSSPAWSTLQSTICRLRRSGCWNRPAARSRCHARRRCCGQPAYNSGDRATRVTWPPASSMRSELRLCGGAVRFLRRDAETSHAHLFDEILTCAHVLTRWPRRHSSWLVFSSKKSE